MKFIAIYYLAILISITACKQTKSGQDNTAQITANASRSIQDNPLLGDWKKAINSRNKLSLEKAYRQEAIKIISADSVVTSSSQIANYYTAQNYKITSAQSIFTIEANTRRKINYDVVKFKTDQQEEYTQIVIWTIQNDTITRAFEFTGQYDVAAAKVDTSRIANRRQLWMQLCNADNAENLVRQLYSPNTMYYNHKPLVLGLEDLTKEYSYMNNPSYNLQLHPIILEVVNSNLAFEIGQCSGGYNGKYILVWKKQPEGDWKVFIDSNI